jgi:hypothetical protein
VVGVLYQTVAAVGAIYSRVFGLLFKNFKVKTVNSFIWKIPNKIKATIEGARR